MSNNHVSALQEKELDVYPSRVHSEPRILKRQDPVVHSEWTPDAALTQEQSDFYERNGYLFLEDFFGPEELSVYQAEARSLQVSARELNQDEVIREPGGNEVRSVFAVHESHEVFKKLSRHPRLVAIMEYLLGARRISINRGLITNRASRAKSSIGTPISKHGMLRMACLV